MPLFGSTAATQLAPADRARLLDQLRQALALEARVRVAFVFGSFARGEPFRDVDLAVELDEPFRLLEVGGWATRLWEAAARPRFELDVVPLNDAPPSFRRTVADQGMVLFERHPGDAFELGVQATSDAIDFRVAWEAAAPRERSE